MYWRRAGTIGVGLACIALTAGCGGAGSSGGDGGVETLTIGDVTPLTGPLAIFGPSSNKAAKLAVEEANKAAKAAGINLRFTLKTADEQSDPQAAVAAARTLVSGGATCLTGVHASADLLAIGKSISARQRIPVIAPETTSAEVTTLDDNGFVFRTAPSNNLQGPALAKVVADKLGGAEGKKISLAGRNDAYGQGLLETVADAWKKMGGKVQGPLLYDPAQASYTSEAQRIVAGDPDGYVIADFPEPYDKVGAALLRTGKFHANKLFVPEALAAEKVPEGIPADALVGATGTQPSTPSSAAATKAYKKLYQAAAGPKADRPFDAYDFDAPLLCALAAVAADSTKGSEIQRHIKDVSAPSGATYTWEKLADAFKALSEGKDIDYEGVSGPINLDDAGDPTSVIYDIFTYSADGTLKVDRQTALK